MNKHAIYVIVIVLISLVFIDIGYKKSTIALTENENIPDLTIKFLHSVPADNTLFFEVRDKENNKLLGNFRCKPWLGKNPLYQELPGGDIIIGNDNLFRRKSSALHPLFPMLNSDLLDYAVYEDRIAFICNKKNNSEIYIYIKNLTNNQLLLIDSFAYNELPRTLFASWGKDGLLYYDYILENKQYIKAYDINTKQYSIFMEDAANPQVSPCGGYMVAKNDYSGYILLKIDDKSKAISLEQCSRLFWERHCVVVWNADKGLLQFYSLIELGQKLQEISIESNYPFAIELLNQSVIVKSYKPQNDKIIQQNYEITFYS